MTHPVVRARKPFGLFLDIMDYQCVAVDGNPVNLSAPPLYLRLDSHGRVFIKSPDTNHIWEKIGQIPTGSIRQKHTGK